jgi:DEAD/DEAH box helicase domain-containing protein
MEVLQQDRSGPPPGVDWPESFGEVLKYARRTGGRPREFDYIAQLGADNPHVNYPLRQIGEADYELKLKSGMIGDISVSQALREAYPGANHLHLGHSYKVLQWTASSFERSIRLEATKSHAPTKPIQRKTVNLALDHASVIENRIKRCPSAKGLVAETNLQVNESVEGYRIGSKSFLYRDLRAENPNMSRKQRDIRTTGAVIMIDEPWFAGSSGDAPANREAFGRALIGVLSRERSISPQDIDFASTNIAVLTEQGPKRASNCLVIYDVVYGGIRLTEDLFDRFEEYLAQISRASALAGSDAIVTKELAAKLEAWASTLATGEADERAAAIMSDGWYQIYRPGSIVSMYHHGQLVSRELIAPKLLDPLGDGSLTLYYSYKLGGRQSLIAHEQVHPSGENWSYVLWSPETNELRELDLEGGHSAVDQSANGHWVKVYRPGTRIKIQHHNRTVEREIIEARIVKDQQSDTSHIEYAYLDGGGYGYVPARLCSAHGQ